MDIPTIQAEQRADRGRNANERLRRRGYIPAVVYGHGETPEMLALSLHDLELALESHAHVIQVQVNGGPHQYLLKEIQYDHLQKTPVHADLMRFNPDERVEVSVAITLRGEARGVKEGGVLVQVNGEVRLECPVTAIPDELRVSIEDLGIGDSRFIRDLNLPEGVRALQDPDEPIVVIQAKRGMTEEEETVEAPAEGAEPEVIGRGREQSEDEEGS